MTAFYLGVAGTLLSLALLFFCLKNKRLNALLSFWKYPICLLPTAVFAGLLVTHLYVPLKGNGCSYADNQKLVDASGFSADRESGILMFFLENFENCQVNVKMENGRTYSGKTLNNVFALVLPADSGRVESILVGEGKDSIQVRSNFCIKPGQLSYLGTIQGPEGFAMLIPALACKSADITYQTSNPAHREWLKSWAIDHRLHLSPAILECLARLQYNYQSASRFVGVQYGYLPFTSASLKGKPRSQSPEEVVREYKDYEFLFK